MVDEKPDVAIITPAESPEEPEPEPTADKCEGNSLHSQLVLTQEQTKR